ncbi:MAG: DNA-3-methyladenine glycosylase [Bacillota bacterium]
MRDHRLARLIDTVGDVAADLRGTPFSALVRSIVGQQLSGRAAASIWAKLQSACGEVSPARLERLDDGTLRAAGLSRPKVAYLRDLTHRTMSGDLDLAALPSMSDEQLIQHLTAVHGIGVWTAQMFMIFCLGRSDVFAPKDLGLRSAMKWLYSLPALPSEKESIPIAETWRPYRTVASLYLWEAVTRKLTQPGGTLIPR